MPLRAGEERVAKPEMLAPAGIVTVPVKVGLAIGEKVEAAVAEVKRPRVEKLLFFQSPEEVS